VTTVVHRNKPHGVYIGRAYSMLPESPYHNPFHIGRDGDRFEVILKFAVYWYAEEQRKLREQARKELLHRILGCWCKPQACHGDIIAGYVNWREVFEHPTKVGNMICEICGKKKSDVQTVLDPYARDVNDEEVERDLCGDCYQQRCDDI
jgi:hypothetical protein